MSVLRVQRVFGAFGVTPAEGQPGQSAGPVVLFIGAVLIAGLTCILYLWEQSEIVSTQLTIRDLDTQIAMLTTQQNQLATQVNLTQSVSQIVAEATKDGMVMANSSHLKQVAVEVPVFDSSSIVAQNQESQQTPVMLPSTNAAITSWWQDAWDSLFNLVQ